VNTEELIAGIILEEEDDNDLLVYCMSDSATDILKKRKDEGLYCTLVGKYLMDSETKCREFFGVSRNILYVIFLILKQYKG
jgi:hypothetical protein